MVVFGLLSVSEMVGALLIFYFLFVAGLVGFMYSAHLLGCLVFIELGLLGAGPLALFFGWLHHSVVGAVVTVALISIGAAEAAVGLGFVIAAVLQLRAEDFGRLRFTEHGLQ